LIKSVAAAAILALAISAIAIYILPSYIYVNPFSSFYASGIVDHKKIGYSADGGVQSPTYTVSVTLFNDDPVNRINGGNTLAYIVSKTDWNKVAWGDTVKIKLLPSAKAEVVEVYPTLSPPAWQPQISLNVALTADKNKYTIGEDAVFKFSLATIPPISGDYPNVSLTFDSRNLYVFSNGKTVYLNESSFGVEPLTTFLSAPNEGYSFDFHWKLVDISPGVYNVRAYMGHLTGNEEAILTSTMSIYVFD
jgi:hypothetical protein